MDKVVSGSLLKICKQGKTSEPIYLQAHQVKSIAEPNGERLRMMLNDGEYMINGVFKPNENQSTIDGFKRYCVLKISDYEITPTQAGKIFLVVEAGEVVGHGDKPAKHFINLDEQNVKKDGGDISDDKENTPDKSTAATKKAGSGSAAGTASSQHANLYSIDQLSPYQNNWTIKARVSFKSDMRTWSNARGEGKLFNVNFLDETGEIRATGFNAMADKFFDLLQENKVYYVSKCSMQMAKPQYSHLSHQYELQFDRDTVIEPCDDDDADVPKANFQFVKLDQIQQLENNTVVDVVGVLQEVHEKTEIVAKSTGKPFDRRDVIVVDDTNFAVSVTVWNKHARDFNLDVGTVVAFKGVRVHDYNGKTLSLIPSGTIYANPDVPEAHQLKGWYDSQGSKENFHSIKNESSSKGDTNLSSKASIAERKTIKQVQDEQIGYNEKPDYFSLKATVTFVKPDNFCYPACQTDGCSKKVFEQGNGQWRCEKCNKEFSEPNYRYILTLSVVDETGQLWLTLFDDPARAFMGATAKELMEMKEGADENALKRYINQAVAFKEYAFRVRARLDNYNGIDRARFNAVGIANIDFANEVDALTDDFDKLGM